MYDCKELKELIINNPELPLLIFCSEYSYGGEYHYESVEAEKISCKIQNMALYNDEIWLDKDEYKDKVKSDLWDKHMNETMIKLESLDESVSRELNKVEFTKVISIVIG